MDQGRRVLKLPVLDVDYELLVTDPERVSREVLAWCGLEWDAACALPRRTRRAVLAASAIQVRRPIYHSSVGRWKKYARALPPVFAELEKRL
jgi:Sulfotransferase family